MDLLEEESDDVLLDLVFLDELAFDREVGNLCEHLEPLETFVSHTVMWVLTIWLVAAFGRCEVCGFSIRYHELSEIALRH